LSFDVFLQGFDDNPDDRTRVVREIVDTLLDPKGERITTSDGSADVYGLESVPLNGLMFNHIAGEVAWDVIYAVGRAAGWAIFATDHSPCCIPDESLRSAIPEGLADQGVVFVASGRELREAVTS
jgi:hypothetical protein